MRGESTGGRRAWGKARAFPALASFQETGAGTGRAGSRYAMWVAIRLILILGASGQVLLNGE